MNLSLFRPILTSLIKIHRIQKPYYYNSNTIISHKIWYISSFNGVINEFFSTKNDQNKKIKRRRISSSEEEEENIKTDNR